MKFRLPTLTIMWSIALHLALRTTGLSRFSILMKRTARIFVSCLTLDPNFFHFSDGKFVELTTCNLKRSHNELRYYLRAVFTGQTRLIVGVCNENYLRSIREVNPVKSPQAICNGTLALNYLSEFLKDVSFTFQV